MDMSPEIEVSASDHASDRIGSIADEAENLDGSDPNVEIGANDTASGTIMDVQDRASELDSSTADVDVGANDTATDIITDAMDTLSEFDGETGEADIGVNDNATSVVRAAEDAVEEFSGSSGAAEITANDTASSVIDEVTDKAQEWGGSVWTGTLAVAGSALSLLGITTSISDTVSTYEDFEAAMSQVEAISGTSGTALEDLTAKAKEMGSTTKYTATEAAEAMTYMAMAGWEASDMLDGIEGIMNLAAASGEDLATTSDIVTDALTAFGLSASDSDHFADVLATAASSANTTVSGMGETFKYAGSMAGALGYSIEDVALATGLMANSGIKGSMAGTALNTIFTRLSTNTSGAADALEELGIDFYDSEGNARDLSDVLEELRVATADYTDEQLTALANTVAGTEAQKGLLAILNASEEDYNSLSDAINNADGSAADMADTMLDNLEGSLTLMNSAIDGVKTSLGERIAPYIEAVAEAITEAAPDIESGLMGIMDAVDQVAEDYQSKISEMTSSDAWQEADLFGKIDIAWDTLIVEPFKDWITTDGASLMSDGIYTLFSEAVKILPGGDDAGITSWISAAILGKGAMTIASGASSIVSALEPVGTAISNVAAAASSAGSVGEFVSSVGSMIPMAGKVGIAAAAIVGAIALISSAIDDYNDKQLSSSLEEHFGNIELSAQEAADAAEQLLHTEYMVNVELILNEVENADQLANDAEEALADNDVLEWKSGVNITLTADEQTEYTDNIETFVTDKIGELESRAYTAHVAVTTFLGGTVDGTALDEAIASYALSDELEMTELSEQLQSTVDEAISDGILSVDEQQHISELQDKINAITNKWAEAENQAQLDWINQEYGSLSGAELTSDSYTAMVEALAEQRETNAAETESAAKSFYQILNAMDSAGRLGEENGLLTADEYKSLAAQAIRNSEAENLANVSLAYESNTMTDTYGSKISENLASSQEESASQIADVESYFQDVQNGVGHTVGLADLIAEGESAWNSGNGKGAFGVVNDADQNALNTLYESMKPDVTAMGELIDEYTAAGQAVPQAVMDAYNEAIEIGAAAGDSDAAWQAYANDLIANGSEELVNALTDESNPMYEALRNSLPEEMTTAIDRATAEVTDEPISLDELTTQLNGTEVEGMDEWLASIQEQLDAAGNLGTVEATADGEITVTVDQGDNLSAIADVFGISLEELEAANQQIFDERGTWDLIYEGDVIYIPDVTVDAESAEIDTSAVDEAVDESLDSAESTTETTYDTMITVEAEEVNTEDAVTEAQETLDEDLSETYEADGYTDITYSETNNADEVYEQASSELQEVFYTTIPVDASAVITIDYSIANPSASIQLSSGGTASATISASVAANATGGEVGLNGAELSWVGEEGLEYIIPTVPSRRGRGIDLWEQAGMALGVLDSDGNISAYANGGAVGSGAQYYANDSVIPLVDGDRDEEIWSVTGEKITGDSEVSGNDTETTVRVEQSAGGGNTFNVSVDCSPLIQIDGEGMDEDQVFEVMRSRIREVADDLGDEMAEKLTKIFQNMPVTAEA